MTTTRAEKPLRRPRLGAGRAWVLALSLLLAGCATTRAPESVPPGAPATERKPDPAPNAGQTGVASWYGEPHHGRPTSNGETYDMYQLTAAHPTLPMDTRVLVTNLKNGRSVEVRINDRGPHVAGRIIDLSFAAARQLGATAAGTIPVRIRVVSAPAQ